MVNSLKTTIVLTFLSIFAASASVASANEFANVDRLALDIQFASNQLLQETVHYRNTPYYNQMVEDCVLLNRHATHLRSIIHREVDIFLVEADLAKLDRIFHHLENLFDNTEIQASYGRGRVRGNTAHVKDLLNQIDSCIKQLQRDVAKIRRRTEAQLKREYKQQQRVRRDVIVHQPVYSKPVYNRPVQSVYGRSVYKPKGKAKAKAVTKAKINSKTRAQSFKKVDHYKGKKYSGSKRNPGSRGSFNRTSNRGIGFTIGGGSSKVRINF